MLTVGAAMSIMMDLQTKVDGCLKVRGQCIDPQTEPFHYYFYRYFFYAFTLAVLVQLVLTIRTAVRERRGKRS